MAVPTTATAETTSTTSNAPTTSTVESTSTTSKTSPTHTGLPTSAATTNPTKATDKPTVPTASSEILTFVIPYRVVETSEEAKAFYVDTVLKSLREELRKGNNTHSVQDVKCISLSVTLYECGIVSTPIPAGRRRRAAGSNSFLQGLLNRLDNTIAKNLKNATFGNTTLTANNSTQNSSATARDNIPEPKLHRITIPPPVLNSSQLTDESWIVVRVAIIKSLELAFNNYSTVKNVTCQSLNNTVYECDSVSSWIPKNDHDLMLDVANTIKVVLAEQINSTITDGIDGYKEMINGWNASHSISTKNLQALVPDENFLKNEENFKLTSSLRNDTSLFASTTRAATTPTVVKNGTSTSTITLSTATTEEPTSKTALKLTTTVVESTSTTSSAPTTTTVESTSPTDNAPATTTVGFTPTTSSAPTTTTVELTSTTSNAQTTTTDKSASTTSASPTTTTVKSTSIKYNTLTTTTAESSSSAKTAPTTTTEKSASTTSASPTKTTDKSTSTTSASPTITTYKSASTTRASPTTTTAESNSSTKTAPTTTTEKSASTTSASPTKTTTNSFSTTSKASATTTDKSVFSASKEPSTTTIESSSTTRNAPTTSTEKSVSTTSASPTKATGKSASTTSASPTTTTAVSSTTTKNATTTTTDISASTTKASLTKSTDKSVSTTSASPTTTTEKSASTTSASPTITTEKSTSTTSASPTITTEKLASTTSASPTITTEKLSSTTSASPTKSTDNSASTTSASLTKATGKSASTTSGSPTTTTAVASTTTENAPTTTTDISASTTRASLTKSTDKSVSTTSTPPTTTTVKSTSTEILSFYIPYRIQETSDEAKRVYVGIVLKSLREAIGNGNATHSFQDVPCISLNFELYECKIVSAPKSAGRRRRAAASNSFSQGLLNRLDATLTNNLANRSFTVKPTKKISIDLRPDILQSTQQNITIPIPVADSSQLTDESWFVVRVAVIKSIEIALTNISEVDNVTCRSLSNLTYTCNTESTWIGKNDRKMQDFILDVIGKVLAEQINSTITNGTDGYEYRVKGWDPNKPINTSNIPHLVVSPELTHMESSSRGTTDAITTPGSKTTGPSTIPKKCPWGLKGPECNQLNDTPDVIGAITGGSATVLLIVIVIWYAYQRNKKKSKESKEDKEEGSRKSFQLSPMVAAEYANMRRISMLFPPDLDVRIPRAGNIDRQKLNPVPDPIHSNGRQLTYALAYAPEVPIPSDGRNPAYVDDERHLASGSSISIPRTDYR